MAVPKKDRNHTWRQDGTIKFRMSCKIWNHILFQFIKVHSHGICIWLDKRIYKHFCDVTSSPDLTFRLRTLQVRESDFWSDSESLTFWCTLCWGFCLPDLWPHELFWHFWYRRPSYCLQKRASWLDWLFWLDSQNTPKPLASLSPWDQKNVVKMCYKSLHSFMPRNTSDDCSATISTWKLPKEWLSTWGKCSPQKYFKSPQGDLSITLAGNNSWKLENCPLKLYLNSAI